MKESSVIKIIAIVSLILLLAGGYLFWRNDWAEKVFLRANIAGIGKGLDRLAFLRFVPELTGFGREKTYLFLFYNNLELRPTGGYLGNFGIAKIENGEIKSFEIHDTNIFDGFGKVKTEPPRPIKEYLKVDNWQMRDSNWSPDFPSAAAQAGYFYKLQGGQENFDGIIAINASVLPGVLNLTGPIYLEQFNEEFNAENVLYQLEYEVEKRYVARGIDPGERKLAFKTLVKALANQLASGNFWQDKKLRNFVFQELNKKNILLFFKNSEIQKAISGLKWDGKIDLGWPGDYLMINEANLGGKKSNAFIKREIEYSVDLSREKPEAKLKITYTHQGEQKDWFSDDYRFFLRVYVPNGSWLSQARGTDSEAQFAEEFGKTVFGGWTIVPVNSQKTIEYDYFLPEKIKQGDIYRLLIEKQAGVNQIPIKIIVKDKDGQERTEESVIEKNWLKEF